MQIKPFPTYFGPYHVCCWFWHNTKIGMCRINYVPATRSNTLVATVCAMMNMFLCNHSLFVSPDIESSFRL